MRRKAAKRVIVLAEEIVAGDYLRQQPELTRIAGLRVDQVVHVPYGAHPTSLYRCYDYDSDHLREYVAASRTPDSYKAYLDKYVFGVSEHDEYLELVGSGKLAELKADPKLGY